MFALWISFLVVNSAVHLHSFVQSAEQCRKMKHLEDPHGFLQCESFCITYECKQCRMICLSDHCDSDSDERNCRIQQFLSTNCNLAKERMRTKNLERVQGNKIRGSCDITTGYLPPSDRNPYNDYLEPIDLSLKCGNEFQLLQMRFEMKGNGQAQIVFYKTKQLSTTYFNPILSVNIFMVGDNPSTIEVRISYKRYKSEATIKLVNQFWIKITRLQSEQIIFTMGEGQIMGRGTLLNITSLYPEGEIGGVTAFSSLGNIDWKFTY